MHPPAEAKPELAGKQNPQCLQLRDDLLASIQAAQLPPNFLDELVDALGGARNVAEMTGLAHLAHQTLQEVCGNERDMWTVQHRVLGYHYSCRKADKGLAPRASRGMGMGQHGCGALACSHTTSAVLWHGLAGSHWSQACHGVMLHLMIRLLVVRPWDYIS